MKKPLLTIALIVLTLPLFAGTVESGTAPQDKELFKAYTEVIQQTEKKIEYLNSLYNGMDCEAQPKKCKALESAIVQNMRIIEIYQFRIKNLKLSYKK